MKDKPNWFERWPWFRWRNRPLDAQEIERLETAWLQYAAKTQREYHKIERRHDGIWVSLTPESHLHIQPSRIAFHGNAANEDAAFVAAIDHAREHWGGELAVSGSEDFKLRSWAHAQASGLRVTNYEPPEHLQDRAVRLADQIRARNNVQPPQKAAPPPEVIIPNGTTDETVLPVTASPSAGLRFKTSDYVPPRNAVNDLFLKASPEMREAMREPLAEIRRKNPVGTWPDEPYHYGMGRIMAYEMMLARLSEDDRKMEIAAARGRYEAHYFREAHLLISAMQERGHDMGFARSMSGHELAETGEAADSRRSPRVILREEPANDGDPNVPGSKAARKREEQAVRDRQAQQEDFRRQMEIALESVREDARNRLLQQGQDHGRGGPTLGGGRGGR